MDCLDLIQFYFDLGHVDVLQVLAVKHDAVLSLRSLQPNLHGNGLFCHKNFDSADVIQLTETQLQGSGAPHKCFSRSGALRQKCSLPSTREEEAKYITSYHIISINRILNRKHKLVIHVHKLLIRVQKLVAFFSP